MADAVFIIIQMCLFYNTIKDLVAFKADRNDANTNRLLTWSVYWPCSTLFTAIWGFSIDALAFGPIMAGVGYGAFLVGMYSYIPEILNHIDNSFRQTQSMLGVGITKAMTWISMHKPKSG